MKLHTLVMRYLPPGVHWHLDASLAARQREAREALERAGAHIDKTGTWPQPQKRLGEWKPRLIEDQPTTFLKPADIEEGSLPLG